MRHISPPEDQRLQNEFLAVMGSTPSNAPIDDRHRAGTAVRTIGRDDMTTADVTSAAPKTTEGLGLREAAKRVWMFWAALLVSAFCCFCMLFVLYVVCATILGVDGWEDDWVSLPADGGALELTGVPGEEIKLELFQADSSPDTSKSSVYLQLTDAESGFQTTLPARLKAEYGPIYALIPAPGVPGRKAASLTGTLWGQVVLKTGEARSVEVPVSLRVVQHGEAKTSGHVDNSGADRAWLVFVLAACVATGVMTALVYADWLEKKSESWIASIGHWLASNPDSTGTNGGL